MFLVKLQKGWDLLILPLLAPICRVLEAHIACWPATLTRSPIGRYVARLGQAADRNVSPLDVARDYIRIGQLSLVKIDPCVAYRNFAGGGVPILFDRDLLLVWTCLT